MGPPRRGGKSLVPPLTGLPRASANRTRLVLCSDLETAGGISARGGLAPGDCLRLRADRSGFFIDDHAQRSGVGTAAVGVEADAGLPFVAVATDATAAVGVNTGGGAGAATAWQGSSELALACWANSSRSAAPSSAPGEAAPGDSSIRWGGDGIAPRRSGVFVPPRASRRSSKAPRAAPGVKNCSCGGEGAAGLGVVTMAPTPVCSDS